MPCTIVRRSAFASFLVITSLGLGCSGSSLNPASPSSATPVGGDQSGTSSATDVPVAGSWNLVSVQPSGQAEQTKPAGATYTLSFADGRISTKVDCNVCTGAGTLSEGKLTAGPNYACTRAWCSTMPFSDSYLAILTGESTALASDSTLVLSSSRGVLRFTR